MSTQRTVVSRGGHRPADESFLCDVLDGLRQQPKQLPCKYFYDQRGSRLFDRICEQDEYYLTRTELKIMRQFAGEMAAKLGPDVMLVELGSGSSVKTRELLRHLIEPSAYVPVDISREHLQESADRVSQRFPTIEVLPVCADFAAPFRLPTPVKKVRRRVVYFPGSTIGNFTTDAALDLLRQIAEVCGPGAGGLLIGIDLQKDVSILEAAYNDAQGVTAEFNLNLLRRINRELDADFDLQQFEHLAYYDDQADRVEIYLTSTTNQTATIGDEVFEFCEGEPIHTENSHKYTVEGFAELAAETGFEFDACWTDSQQLFAVLWLRCRS